MGEQGRGRTGVSAYGDLTSISHFQSFKNTKALIFLAQAQLLTDGINNFSSLLTTGRIEDQTKMLTLRGRGSEIAAGDHDD